MAKSPINPQRLIRPVVRRIHPYTPGEQPSVRGLIKLNTNENPYPPAPEVLAAIRNAVDVRLRLYPNPTSQPLRGKLARLHGCAPENIIIGNGSDELLALAVRAFVEPRGAGPSASRSTVQFFAPSYSLYPVLAATHDAGTRAVPLETDFAIPPRRRLRDAGWDTRAALTFVTTPNAPSGRGYSRDELRDLCQHQRGVIVLDEAYVDFADEDALSLAIEFPHVLVSRTFSKAYSLCFQRIGYFVGHPELIAALDKIRDSYNVNGLAQIAALATLDALPYYRENFRRVGATRRRLHQELAAAGFYVYPSQTNFLLVRPPALPAQRWLEHLRDRKILVRWFSHERISDCLRITVGDDREANALIRAVKAILKGAS